MYLQFQSGAKIEVTRDNWAEPGAYTRQVELLATPEQISKLSSWSKPFIDIYGFFCIHHIGIAKLLQADAGPSGTGSLGRKHSAPQPGTEMFPEKNS
jgi:far upstream element-binding protein